MSLGNPQVSIGEIVGLTPRHRAAGSLVAALIIHVCLLPYWFAVGFVWGTPTRTFDVVIVSIYGFAAAFGWPLVVVVLVIWWWQRRGYLGRRVVLAAVTLVVPVALLLLFAKRVRTAVVPPKLGTNSH